MRTLRQALHSISTFYNDSDNYVDFENFVVRHNVNANPSEDTYSSWRFTLCFENGNETISGSYFHIIVNDENGWNESIPVPNEHLMEVWNDMMKTINEILGVISKYQKES